MEEMAQGPSIRSYGITRFRRGGERTRTWKHFFRTLICFVDGSSDFFVLDIRPFAVFAPLPRDGYNRHHRGSNRDGHRFPGFRAERHELRTIFFAMEGRALNWRQLPAFF